MEAGHWHRVSRVLALIVIVCLAAYLRFSGLTWGHRHPIHSDEQVYVENVVKMVEAGDFDHRFYTYPGLFFYILRPGVAALGPEGWHTVDAYLVSRGIVATFGVLNVALLGFVVARLVGIEAGLVAALMAAVSPVDIKTSHQVRPDVILQILGLLAVVLLHRVGRSLRWDAAMGLLIGLAAAIKFTGLLLVPAYLFARLVTPGPRLRGMLLAGLLTIAVATACTPYAILHLSEYRGGPPRQLQQYYPGPVRRAMVVQHAGFFLRAGVEALGPIGALSFLMGAGIALRRSWRSWGPPLVHPVVNLLVMSTGSLVFQRYILPPMGVVYLMAVIPVDLLARRRLTRPLAAALSLFAVIPTLSASRDYVYLVSHESASDKALDWIFSSIDPGARILETRRGATIGGTAGSMIGIPADRYELVFHYPEDPEGLFPLLASHMDLVIMDPGPGWKALRPVYVAANAVGTPEAVLKVPRTRPRYVPIDLHSARVTASENEGDLAALFDHDLRTSWKTRRPLGGGEWIQLEFKEPLRLGRVELFLGNRPENHEPEVGLLVSADGDEYEPVPTIAARPPVKDQLEAGRAPSQDLLLRPMAVKGVRVVQTGKRPERWVIAELVLHARLKPGDESNTQPDLVRDHTERLLRDER